MLRVFLAAEDNEVLMQRSIDTGNGKIGRTWIKNPSMAAHRSRNANVEALIHLLPALLSFWGWVAQWGATPMREEVERALRSLY